MGETTETAAPADTDGASLLDLADDAKPDAGKPDPAAASGKPEWLPPQFWDAETSQARYEALAKSWGDFRTKLAKGGLTAAESPDAYKLPVIEGAPADLVKADDPLWQEVREAAHKAGLSPAQLEAVAKPYLAMMAKGQAERGAAETPEALAQWRQQEEARLGPQAKQVLGEVKAWVRGLEGRGHLTADESAALLKGEAGKAEYVRALSKLRAVAGEKPIPVTALEDGQMSVEDAKRMLFDAQKTGDHSMADRARRALREMEAKGLLTAR